MSMTLSTLNRRCKVLVLLMLEKNEYYLIMLPNQSSTVRISQDMADQRKGRAGRLSEGVCIRLYSKSVFMQMDECRRPEIEYADLTPLTLELAKWGETDPKNLLWLTPPPNYSIAQAKETLLQLEALDESGKITPQGIEIQKIPCHPRIAWNI